MVSFCLRQNFFSRKQGILCGAGVVVSGLRTELTVFRTMAAFAVDDGADIKPVGTKMPADFIGVIAQLTQWLLIQAY